MTAAPAAATFSSSATAQQIALGAMLFGTRESERTAFELLDTFVSGGGVWIDTADAYAFWVDPSGFGGQSETVIGRWLQARPHARSHVLLSTKVGCQPLSPGSYPHKVEGLSGSAVRRGLEQSLDRMGVDHVDMVWAHRDDRSTRLEETVAVFGALVAEGLVRRWGYSNTALWRVERARGLAVEAGTEPPTALQLRYSYLQPRPLVRDHDHGHRFGWVTDDVLDYAAHDPGLDLWAYSPLLGGAYDRADRPVPDAFDHPGTTRRLAALASVARALGRSRSEVVIAWLAGSFPRITPIVGVSRTTQIETALTGGAVQLPPDLRAELDAPW